MAEHRPILKNNQNTYYPCFRKHPKQVQHSPKRVFFTVYRKVSREKVTKVRATLGLDGSMFVLGMKLEKKVRFRLSLIKGKFLMTLSFNPVIDWSLSNINESNIRCTVQTNPYLK